MGFARSPFRRELGGFGANTAVCCVIGVELAAVDLGRAIIFDPAWNLTLLLCDLATPYQR